MKITEEQELIDILLSIPSETDRIEFKRLWDWDNKKILRSIVAFANTEWWKIILWIDDPEKSQLKWEERIFGIEENLENYDALKREIIKIIPPFTNFQSEEYKSMNGKTIAILTIEKSEDSFHCWENQVWIRQKKGNRQISPQEIIHYSYAKWFQKADQELVDIDFSLLETKYFSQWRESRDIGGANISDILYKSWLARKHETGKIFPTRAAVLLFAEYPNDILEDKCTVRVFRYTGNLEMIDETPNLIGTPKTINGPIIE